jgi:serine/threonine-protein kinase
MKSGEVVAERYRVDREIGRGGMGAVFLAHDLERDTDVALKVAAAAGHAYEESRSRFEREARLGCALGQSRGFVRVFDWGELEHGRLYLAMDLVRGAAALDLRTGTLAQRLARLEAAARLVERAHALGVIHRDLKPGNFLSDESGQIWLTDFGLAKLVGEDGEGVMPQHTMLTRTGTAMGTPQFMPPEQFEDAKAVGEGADVYALGVMLFYVLTGSYPYDGSNPSEVFTKLIKTQVGELRAPRPRDVAPAIPAKLDALCTLATELDPAKRLTRVGRFVERLAAERAREERGDDRGVEASLITQSPDLGPPPAPGKSRPLATPSSGVQGSLVTQSPESDAGKDFSRVAMRGDQPGDLYRIWQAMGTKPLVVIALSLLGMILSFGSYRVRSKLRQQVTTHPSEPDLIEPPLLTSTPPPVVLEGADEETAQLYREAKAGDADSMLELAIRLEDGDGVDQDVTAAVTWYRKAAQRDNADAMVCLGELYLEGIGVRQSESAARNWFQRAARLGNSDGEMHLRYLEDLEAAERAQRRADRRSRYGR